MFEDFKDILSINELCRALDIGKNTAYKLIHSGQIKSIKVGATHKIPKIHLIDFVMNNAQNCA